MFSFFKQIYFDDTGAFRFYKKYFKNFINFFSPPYFTTRRKQKIILLQRKFSKIYSIKKFKLRETFRCRFDSSKIFPKFLKFFLTTVFYYPKKKNLIFTTTKIDKVTSSLYRLKDVETFVRYFNKNPKHWIFLHHFLHQMLHQFLPIILFFLHQFCFKKSKSKQNF